MIWKKMCGISAQTWCVRNGFELVELNPIQDDEDSDVDDDFPESVGMPRVIQALQAHLWPNLKLKGENKYFIHRSILSTIYVIHRLVCRSFSAIRQN